jgi:hypothetical protein
MKKWFLSMLVVMGLVASFTGIAAAESKSQIEPNWLGTGW